jgi:hypothetical protein
LTDVSVPLTELKLHIVSVEMDIMMLVMLNVKSVTINVPPVNNGITVIFVLLTDNMLQLVNVIMDSGIL